MKAPEVVPTRHPVLDTLPGIYRDPVAGALLAALCEAFDRSLAPVHTVLDNFPAHLDPRTTPPDVLEWLADWVGIALDGVDDDGRRRELVLNAGRSHALRGTARGLRETVAMAFGVAATAVDVVDSGASAWSTVTGAALPGERPAEVLVRVRRTAPLPREESDDDLRRLDRLVTALVPAHVPHRVELVRADVEG